MRLRLLGLATLATILGCATERSRAQAICNDIYEFGAARGAGSKREKADWVPDCARRVVKATAYCARMESAGSAEHCWSEAANGTAGGMLGKELGIEMARGQLESFRSWGEPERVKEAEALLQSMIEEERAAEEEARQ